MFSNYMFNGLYLNPAYAGSHDYWSANLLLRKQWVGFDGAPHSQFFTVDGPINHEKMGLAFILGNDEIGVTQKTRLYADYAYHATLGNGTLSFGLRGGVSYERAQFGELQVNDQSDPLYMNTATRSWLPNFGTGVYYYTSKFYLGLSVPHLLNYEENTNLSVASTMEGAPNQERHYFLNTGYVFHVNDWLDLKPNAMVRYAYQAPVQFDMNLNVLFKKVLWVGASYRFKESVTLLTSVELANRWRVGYAYDINVSKLASMNSGSHELMIAFAFNKEDLGIRSPRYF